MTDDPERNHLITRHLRFGWSTIFAYLAVGIALDALLAFKLDAYVDLRNSTRREMWRLAHSHGALFGLVNVAFALSAGALPRIGARALGRISACLLAGSALMPLGFFLGGAWFYGGDPGLGVLLVPLGAVLLLMAVAEVVRDLFS